MPLTKENYKPRLIDNTLRERLNIFGAISIEGPKWCGKTWSALNIANSAVFLDDSADNFASREKAKLNPNLILDGAYPSLIDEWSEVPEIWDAVRHKCDEDNRKGKYILTESTTLRTEEANAKIHHSGAGRIDRLKMSTMTLFESGDSDGSASLSAILEGKQKDTNSRLPELEDLAYYIVRGGWPENIGMSPDLAHILPRSYLNAVLVGDIDNDGVSRDAVKMEHLLRSLARNECSIAANTTIVSDIGESTSSDNTLNRNSVAEYLSILKKLHLLEDQDAFSVNLRSSDSVGKSAKRHLADTSLACAALGVTVEKLMDDIRTFGLFFESLCEHDLRVYMDTLGGRLKHFRNNRSGLEVNAIVEFPDGRYGAIEVKLGPNGLEEGKETLRKFSEEVERKPDFLCIICGLWNAVVYDKKSGIWTIPITALKP